MLISQYRFLALIHKPSIHRDIRNGDAEKKACSVLLYVNNKINLCILPNSQTEPDLFSTATKSYT